MSMFKVKMGCENCEHEDEAATAPVYACKFCIWGLVHGFGDDYDPVYVNDDSKSY